VVDRITSTAVPVAGTGAFWQYGRVNAYAAVAASPAAVSVDGGHNVMGAAAPSMIWYFAEGYTGLGFDEYLTILNPNPSPAAVTITYYLADGTTQTASLAVGATRRETVAVHSLTNGVGRGLAVSVKVTTTHSGGIVVERPMYFTYGSGLDGGHNVMGATDLATIWYFAEGFTAPGFDEYLTILNPSETTNGSAAIAYFVEGEAAPRLRTVNLPAKSRTTVTVHGDFHPVSNPGGLGRLTNGHATRVVATVPVVVERPMYFRYGSTVDGGHNVIGATALAKDWYFAEGYTNTGFDEYLTMMNPAPVSGMATITYFVEGQATPTTRTLALPGNSRTTVAVHAPVSGTNPGGLGRMNAGHATKVVSTVDIVVERPMYFTYGSGVTDGHNVMGTNAPRTAWYLAEGYTGAGFDEYLTIQNPNPTPAAVTITYYLTDGSTPTVPLLLNPTSRVTVAVHETAQGVGRGKAVAAVVTTTNSGGIVVERPMYFTYTLG
jgi:hypothetical protein